MNKRVGFFLFFCAGLFVCFFVPANLEAKKLKIRKEFKDSLKTNILGTSETFPPYVKIIRSKEGLDYMMREFRQIRNYTVYGMIRTLERELKKINFKKHMLIAVLTQPVDNFFLEISSANINKKKQILEIFVDYSHKNLEYYIPPKKSIYYHMVVVEKSDIPIRLNLNNISTQKKKNQKHVYVSGRLLYWKYSDLQLVPVKIRRKKSIIYYIKGAQVRKLEKYVGRIVTLKGVLSREQDSPFEKDLTVKKVVKVHEKL